MHQYKLAAGLVIAAILAGCGSGSGSAGNQSTKIQYTSQVSFGDSLSDVGTYAVGTVAALHGGKYTVNTLTPSEQNWTELMAATMHLPAPCPAQTGLDGMAADGFSVAVVNHTGCFGYGQGGSRVTLPYGPGNANLDPALGGSPVLGQLTIPVLTQIQNHLAANGGKFSGTEVVFVLAGANDVFVNYATSAVAAGTGAVQTMVTGQVTADVTAQVNTDVTAQVTSDITGGTCPAADAQTTCPTQAEAELWTASFGGNASAQNAAVTAQITADITAGTCLPANAATTCVTQAETELVTAYLPMLAEGQLWTASFGGNATAQNTAVMTQISADITAGTCLPANAATTCVIQAETELTTAYLTTVAEGELWTASVGGSAAAQTAVATQVASDIAAGTCVPANAQATNCVQPAETELVTAYLSAQGNAAGNAAGPTGPGASAAIAAMKLAGQQMAGYINTMIVGNGATHVVVLNVPDIGTTPFGNALAPAALSLVNTLVSTYNTNLQSNLATSSSILFVDVNTQSHLNTQNPAQYGLTNVTVPACNLSAPGNPLGSSLVCTTSNVITGDISNYLFADSVHPTPYGYSLLAKYVSTQMALRGWL